MKFAKFVGHLAAMLLLLGSLGNITCYAAAAATAGTNANVMIALDLENYDTFNEVIEISYSAEGTAIRKIELNQYNQYQYGFLLEPGDYQFDMAVRNDQLGLFHLDPANFTLTIESLDAQMQTIIIEVTDSAGLSVDAGEGDHEELLYSDIADVERTSDFPKKAKEIPYEGKQDEATGYLTITGPDITGANEMNYHLVNQDGDVFDFKLEKEHNFSVRAELPFGQYTETEDYIEVIPEEGITLPGDIIFHYAYYGTHYGQTFVLQEGQKEQKNPDGMQLWFQRGNEIYFKITNLYRFAGEAVVEPEKQAGIFGHSILESEEQSLETAEQVETIQTQEQGDAAIDQEESQKAEPVTQNSKLPLIPSALLITIIILCVIRKVFTRRRG